MSHLIRQLGLVDDDAISLDHAALDLAALDHPGVDLAHYLTMLETFAADLAAIDGAAHSATTRAEALAAVLAGAFGLAGDRDTYDDPRNANLIDVLDRRRGLPVALSILYASAARRIGWQADILNMPGHVLMRLGPSAAPVLIDPFDGGRIVTSEKLGALFRTMLGGTAVPTAQHLAPMSNRMVLVRLLSNQATRAERAGDLDRARTLFDRITTIAPAYGQGWWDRARLQVAGDDVSGARASLGAMLEMTRDGAIRRRISAALEGLASAN